jgi:hypothetical protein
MANSARKPAVSSYTGTALSTATARHGTTTILSHLSRHVIAYLVTMWQVTVSGSIDQLVDLEFGK